MATVRDPEPARGGGDGRRAAKPIRIPDEGRGDGNRVRARARRDRPLSRTRRRRVGQALGARNRDRPRPGRPHARAGAQRRPSATACSCGSTWSTERAHRPRPSLSIAGLAGGGTRRRRRRHPGLHAPRRRPTIAALADLDPERAPGQGHLSGGGTTSPTSTMPEINANYLRLFEQLVEPGSYVGIATHDRALGRARARVDPGRGLGA